MTPQTRVFPRIHTSYYTYELLIHEMTHDTANEGDPGLASRSAPLRHRSETAPGRPRHGPGADQRGPGADPGPARSRDGRPVVEARGPGADPAGAGAGRGRARTSGPLPRPPRRRHRPATRREWTWMRPVRLDSLRIVLPLARAGLAQRRQECTVKLRVDRDVLAEAVTWTARSVPVRPPVPEIGRAHV